MSEQKIKNLKKKIFLTAYRFGAAHLSSAFSVIDFLYVLYGAGFVKIDKSDPWKPDRDRAILSKGHACLAQYVMLNDIGVISDEELAGFCQPGCHLGGEPKYRSLPGIEASTGSLGHGLSFAVGIAMAYKLSDYHGSIYVVIGDGECEEGSIWEAVMSIKRFELNNLILVLDDNKLQAMDSVKNLMGIASWREKFSSYGLHVIEIDGHNVDEIKMGLEAAAREKEPTIIISHTVKGNGVSFMENVPIWHYRMPDESELQILMHELNITSEELKNAKSIS